MQKKEANNRLTEILQLLRKCNEAIKIDKNKLIVIKKDNIFYKTNTDKINITLNKEKYERRITKLSRILGDCSFMFIRENYTQNDFKTITNYLEREFKKLYKSMQKMQLAEVAKSIDLVSKQYKIILE